MKYKKELIVVLLIALLLRFGPIALHGMPLSYDAPFHIRLSQEIVKSEQLQVYDSSLEARPNNYPPLYHLLLAGLAIFSGAGVQEISFFIIPLFSVLLVLSVFVFLRRLAGENAAIVGAILIAVSTPLVAASYDSPEAFVFFFLPIALLWISWNKKFAGASLLGLAVLWNYFIAIMLAVPFLLAYWKQKRVLFYGFGTVLVVIAFYLLSRGTLFFENKSLEIGMDYVLFNLRNHLLFLIVVSSIFLLPMIFWGWRHYRKLGTELGMMQYFATLSYLGLISVLLTPLARGWEHVKFIALGAAMVFAALQKTHCMKVFLIFLAIVALLLSTVLSFQTIFPRINKMDYNAINFLQENTKQGEMVLADPAFSEYIALSTALEKNLLTSLYFENAEENSSLALGLHYLIKPEDREAEQELFARGMHFIAFNFEDFATKNVPAFLEKKEFNKVYSLNYYRSCPLDFLEFPGYGCGELETIVLEKRA